MNFLLNHSDHLWIVPHKKFEKALNNKWAQEILRIYTSKNLKYSANGKPHLETKNIHLSLSHTKDKLFIAVSRNPVGVDAEEIKPRRHIDQIAHRFFPKPSRSSSLQTHAKQSSLINFYREWTAREAFLKIIDGKLLSLKKIHTKSCGDDLSVGFFKDLLHEAKFLMFHELLICLCKHRDAHREISVFEVTA